MSHMSVTGSTESMKASVDGGVQDTAWFLLLRAIHRYKPGLKKGEGGSFPVWQAGEFGIVCSRDTAWFLLLRAIHRYKPGLKKGEGGSFPVWQAGEFGIVCSR